MALGDRDYICNWNGGEAVSLAINYTESAEFRKAGYQDIQVTNSLVGGQVRQHGNLSFARVYDAGHLVPAYQPQVSLAIFERIIFGKSIATGDEIDLSTYSTTGPSNSTKTFKAPPPPEPTCFVRSVRSCNVEEWTTIGNKQGTIINGVWHMSNETFTWGNDVPEPKDDTKTTPKKQQGGGEFEGDQRAGAGMRTPSVSALVLAFVFLVFLA